MHLVQIFLSTVSAEFRSYRDTLSHYLTRPNVSVAVQEDFIATGTETLDMLDGYIRQCDAVIHLVGDMTGAPAQTPSLTVIRYRYPDLGEKLPPLAPFLVPGASALSYTQWEAWLALYHRKPLIIAVPEESTPRDARYELIPEQRAAQQAHLQRLAEVERYPIHFAGVERLAVDVFRSKLFDLFVAAGVAKRVAHLPYPSLGDLFKGRGERLKALHASLVNAPAKGAAAVVGKALHGLGGVGKTRLAVEYAWHHADDYTALLFVGADSPEALQRNLAGLCSRAILELPEYQITEVPVQCAAVMRWLQRNPGWLLILDNVDSEAAAQAAEGLLPQLPGGHVLITSRLSNWSGSVEALPLDVLDTPAAVDFLLARTDAKRRKQADDAEQARILAVELAGLALALEQASAYIAQRRLSMTGYLAEWRGQRDKVLSWYNERLMQYPKSLAVTWQTSVDQLGEAGQRLLQRLAWLAPDPIPESLLDVAVPGATTDDDADAALAELESYSLVVRAADAPVFTIHRLVQTVAQRGADGAALTEALGWISGAFVADPTDVRSWPVLTPLLSHVRAIAAYADEAGIADPTALLMNQTGLLLHGMGLYTQAEPLWARALEIREKSLGPEHPHVAMSLNNLAMLYYAQGAYAKAEPLFARALAIREKSLGPEHPDVAVSLNNLAMRYYAQGAYAKAEPLYARARAIWEKALGPEHPHVAMSLNNLAMLYYAQGAYAKAEPLFAGALAIREKALGPEHPDVAMSLNNLALLYCAQRAYAKAEPLFARALAIWEKALGPEHPDVAKSLNNLALLYYAQGAYVKAEPLYARALAIWEKALGSEHPDVAKGLNNLAMLYHAQGASAKAEPLYARALAIREKMRGPEHLNTHAARKAINSLGSQTVAQVQGSSIAADTHNGVTLTRNSPCPCGSGKRYRQCHGALT